MDGVLLQISVNWGLIIRCLLALLWGILWALAIQFTGWGKYLADRRTYLTVIIGIGMDLAIAFNENWFTVFFVIGSSAIGIVIRSLINESRADDKQDTGYKVKRGLEDIMTLTRDLIAMIEEALQNSEDGKTNARISKCLSVVHHVYGKAWSARRGEYDDQPVEARLQKKTEKSLT